MSNSSHAGEPELYCIELRTAQWENMVVWYRQALGLRSLFRVVDDGYALLAAGATRLALIASRDAGPATPRYSLAIEVPNLEEAEARLRASGTHDDPPRYNPEGYDELVTVDPDGNTVRIFSWPSP